MPDGDIFTDGAAFYGDYPEVAIAGAGIVQIDEEGEVTNAAYICVPSFLPQDAATAEQLAATAALWLAENFMEFVTDCAAVLSASIRREEAAGPKHPAGGLWMLVVQKYGKFVKTKAHRTYCRLWRRMTSSTGWGITKPTR